jgi:hypothetical protein
MKKILISLIAITHILSASVDKPKEYTVEEQLKGLYNESDNLEGFSKKSDFDYMYKYLGDFDKKEQDMMNKLYLYYLHRMNTNKEKYTDMTSEMLDSMDDMKEMKSKGKFITLQTDENQNIKILNGITYYVDFINEQVYSSEMQSFVQNDFKNLYSILYQVEYNRILVFEPKNTKTNYFIVMNLGDLKTFSFKDLKETIDVYLEKKKEKIENKIIEEGM